MRWHRWHALSLSKGRLHKSNPEEEDVDDGLAGRLARLYAPIEGPFEMDGRFEAALQERSARQPNNVPQARRRRLSPKWGITGLAVVAIAVVAVVTAIALPNGGRTTSVASAQAFLADLPERLAVEPGQVVYTRMEVFWRFGSASEEIARGAGLPTENHIRESWQQVGLNDTIVRSRARLLDAAGNLLQETVIEDGVWKEVNPRTGEVRTLGPESQADLRLEGPRMRAWGYRQTLATGQTTVVEQGEDYIVLETRENLTDEDIARRGVDGLWSVPYFGDLEGVTFITLERLNADGTVPLNEVHLLTSEGELILLQSIRTNTALLPEMP